MSTGGQSWPGNSRFKKWDFRTLSFVSSGCTRPAARISFSRFYDWQRRGKSCASWAIKWERPLGAGRSLWPRSAFLTKSIRKDWKFRVSAASTIKQPLARPQGVVSLRLFSRSAPPLKTLIRGCLWPLQGSRSFANGCFLLPQATIRLRRVARPTPCFPTPNCVGCLGSSCQTGERSCTRSLTRLEQVRLKMILLLRSGSAQSPLPLADNGKLIFEKIATLRNRANALAAQVARSKGRRRLQTEWKRA